MPSIPITALVMLCIPATTVTSAVVSVLLYSGSLAAIPLRGVPQCCASRSPVIFRNEVRPASCLLPLTATMPGWLRRMCGASTSVQGTSAKAAIRGAAIVFRFR